MPFGALPFGSSVRFGSPALTSGAYASEATKLLSPGGTIGLGSKGMPGPLATAVIPAAITAGSQLAGAVFSGKGQNKAQDKQLAYMKEQDAKAWARQLEIDAAQKEEAARANAYQAARDAYASEYSAWRAGTISGTIPRSTPPPQFKFDYGNAPAGAVPPVPTSPAQTLGGRVNPAALQMAALIQPDQTLGGVSTNTKLSTDVPWDWNRRGGELMRPKTLGSLVGRA